MCIQFISRNTAGGLASDTGIRCVSSYIRDLLRFWTSAASVPAGWGSAVTLSAAAADRKPQHCVQSENLIIGKLEQKREFGLTDSTPLQWQTTASLQSRLNVLHLKPGSFLPLHPYWKAMAEAHRYDSCKFSPSFQWH